MAPHAGPRGNGCRMFRSGVATGTAPVVIACGIAQGLMGRMARQAREGAAARVEARTPAEIQRLMAGVPGIRPVRVFAGRRGPAMATAAETVQLNCRHPSWISNWPRRTGVRGARTMARLTLHSRLERLDFESGSESQGSRRMALETAQNPGARVERAIPLSGPGAMSRRNRQ